MPNWCENRIEVTGDKDSMISMISLVEKGNNQFSFDKVVPYPKEYADADANSENYAGFNSGGYRWCVNNWGTKWESDNATISFCEEPLFCEIDFLTAWSPSLPITYRLSELYPTLVFKHKFEENGMNFSGEFVFQNGEVLEQKEGNFGEYRIFEDDYYDDYYDRGED